MDLIRIAIDRPVAVIAAVMMAVMFGALALARIPIQLTPDVRKPVIEIETIWSGAAPAEVEREIVNPQEDELRGLEGLETMISRSETGRARMNAGIRHRHQYGPGAAAGREPAGPGLGTIRRRRTSRPSTPRAPTTTRSPG